MGLGVQYEEVWDAHHDSVHWFFCRHGFSEQEALDLAQDTFLRVYQGAVGFRQDADGKPDLKTWIYVIAANVYRNEIRHRRAQRRDAKTISLDLQPEDSSDRSFSLEFSRAVARAGRQLDEVYARERLRRLWKLVPRLPPRMRETFLLHNRRGYCYADIATLMGVSVVSVKSRIHEARRRLLFLLDDESGSSGRKQGSVSLAVVRAERSVIPDGQPGSEARFEVARG